MIQESSVGSKALLTYSTWSPVIVMAVAAAFGGVCAFLDTNAVEFTCHPVDNAEYLPPAIATVDPGVRSLFGGATIDSPMKNTAHRRRLRDRVSCSVVKYSVGYTWLFSKPSTELHFASSDWMDAIVTTRHSRHGKKYDLHVVLRDKHVVAGNRVLLHTFSKRPRWALARMLGFLERVKRSQGDVGWKHAGAELDARTPSSWWSWVPFSSWFTTQPAEPLKPLRNEELHNYDDRAFHFHYAVETTYFDEVVVVVSVVVFALSAIFWSASETLVIDKNTHMFLLTQKSVTGLTTHCIGCSLLDIGSFNERVKSCRRKRGSTYVTVLEYGIDVHIKPQSRGHVKKSEFRLMCGETTENRFAVQRTLSKLKSLLDAARRNRGVGSGWGVIDEDGAIVQPGSNRVVDEDELDLESMGAGSGDAEQDESGGSSQTCCICMSRKSNTVFLPCGHVCTCSRCASQLVQRKANPQCPFCRAAVVSRARVYL